MRAPCKERASHMQWFRRMASHVDVDVVVERAVCCAGSYTKWGQVGPRSILLLSWEPFAQVGAG